MKTLAQYDAVMAKCKEIFLKKTRDYGTAWRILRPTSLTDQLYIKAKRIRNLEETKTQKIADSIDSEYQGIINYAIMALIQLELNKNAGLNEEVGLELEIQKVETLYDEQTQIIRDLLALKNHDYGEAWRDMRMSSFTDMILMKLLRIKQIEENEGQTLISEGLDANYQDIVNYAVFALIKKVEEVEKV
ncbi:DUF1599 domain-containing protein [Haliscomenobacter sp.]|uniref:DUF1599 domain-containing protein n=1 Tax=Haliscomenobacter sp. TaxID=2717303 RepID=UPI0035942A21